MRIVSVAMAVILALSLSACDDKDTSSIEPGRGPSTKTEITSPPRIYRRNQRDASIQKRLGHTRSIQVVNGRVILQVPKGWIGLDAASALDEQDAPAIERAASRLGLTPDALVSAFENGYEAVIFSNQDQRPGLTTNIVIGVTMDKGTSVDEELRSATLGEGATRGEIVHIDSDAGDIARMSYTVQRGGTVHGVALIVDSGEQIVTMAVTASSARQAEGTADLIEGSIRHA